MQSNTQNINIHFNFIILIYNLMELAYLKYVKDKEIVVEGKGKKEHVFINVWMCSVSV